jgi:hypothetical protein
MRISVMDFSGNIFSFDLDNDCKIEGLKLTIEIETSITSSMFCLMYEGKILVNFQTL